MRVMKHIRLTNLQFELLYYMKAHNWDRSLADYLKDHATVDECGYLENALRELGDMNIIENVRDITTDTIKPTANGLQKLGW